jgi:hypothetical protein
LKIINFTPEESLFKKGKKFSQSDKNFNSHLAVCHSPLSVLSGVLDQIVIDVIELGALMVCRASVEPIAWHRN